MVCDGSDRPQLFNPRNVSVMSYWICPNTCFSTIALLQVMRHLDVFRLILLASIKICLLSSFHRLEHSINSIWTNGFMTKRKKCLKAINWLLAYLQMNGKIICLECFLCTFVTMNLKEQYLYFYHLDWYLDILPPINLSVFLLLHPTNKWYGYLYAYMCVYARSYIF